MREWREFKFSQYSLRQISIEIIKILSNIYTGFSITSHHRCWLRKLYVFIHLICVNCSDGHICDHNIFTCNWLAGYRLPVFAALTSAAASFNAESSNAAINTMYQYHNCCCWCLRPLLLLLSYLTLFLLLISTTLLHLHTHISIQTYKHICVHTYVLTIYSCQRS